MEISKRVMLTAAVCFYIFYIVFSAAVASAAPQEAASLPADALLWTREVLVLPPDDGWDKNAGASIKNTLEWYALDVSEKGDGINGHDLNFVFLPPLTEDTAESYVFPVAPHTAAVLSFASEYVNKLLTGAAERSGVPLMLAGGEDVFFFKDGGIMPFMFALDLFRDYRCRAFADYARETLSPSSRLGILGTRFTLNEEREAKICFDLFEREGFMPMPYWLDTAASDSFSLVEQEIKDGSDGVLISYAGGMASKEIWHGITAGYRSPYRLWYGDAPNKSFLSFNGMFFADQNMYLEERGGFEQLKRDLWATRATPVTDKTAAARANALASWLASGLAALPREADLTTKEALFAALADVRGIPFGSQTLDIDGKTHRPARRQVYMLQVRERNFFVLDTLDVQGLEYYDY